MSAVMSTARTIVMFRKNNLDAWIAAFIYWWLFGKDSIRPSDTIVHDGPMIRFQAVDVFAECTPRPTNDGVAWSPKVAAYIGTGETILSVGINMIAPLAASRFFSYENDTTFQPGMNVEGCYFAYNQDKFLTELMLESLIDAGHIHVDDKNFIILNQFFQFFDGKKSGFQFNEGVCEKLITQFPQLRVEDFAQLNLLISDPLAFMEKQRKRSPEEAVREHIHYSRQQAFELSTMAGAYQQQVGIPLRLVNSDQALSAQPTSFRKNGEAIFVYRFVTEGVRGHYFSSTHGENALTVFPEDRPRIGNPTEAEWLITMEDFFSLTIGGK